MILSICALLQAVVSCILGVVLIRQARQLAALRDRVRDLEARCDDGGIYADGPRGVLQ